MQKKDHRTSIPLGLPGLDEILFLATFAGVAALGPRLLNQDGDLGRHLTIGNFILSSHTIPTQDLFSHTLHGRALTPHEWLAQVILALPHKWAGLSGVVILVSLVIAITWWLAFRQSLALSRRPLVSLGTSILSLAAASLHFLARPHVFTLLFLVIWMGLLDKWHRDPSSPFWKPLLLMLIWVNTHGAFIAGFACFLAYWTEALWNFLRHRTESPIIRNQFIKLSLLGIALFVVSLINPAGLRLWETSLGFVTNRYLVSHTQEYLPPDFHSPATWPFLIMLLLSLGLSMTQKGPFPLSKSLLAVGWTAMALTSARNIPLYALVMTPILSELLAKTLSNSPWDSIEEHFRAIQAQIRFPIWASAGSLLLIVMLLSNPTFKQRNQFDPSVFPVQATEWILTEPLQGNMMNYFTWGGYLLYRLWPDYQVFIDGQTDFYGEELTRIYESVLTLDNGWDAWLKHYQVQWVIFPGNSDLIRALQHHPDWKCPYHDETAVICHRR